MRARKYNSHGPTSFLKNTYELLSNESISNIICWAEDGSSFIIFDLFNFTNTVLPTYFKHSNLASFIRQLNMYGFHKIKDDQQIIQFSHPMFHRDKKHLLQDIHRKSSEAITTLSKEEISTLTERLKKFQNQQNLMETMLETLEGQYSEVLEQNQQLLSDLFQSKQRERQMEVFLQNFAQQRKEDAQSIEEKTDDSLLWNVEPQYPSEFSSGDEIEKRNRMDEYKEDYSND